MQCCTAAHAARRKQQNTPTLNGRKRWGEGGGWIVLFSEVTLFEYTVSKVLLPIAAQIVQFLNTLDCLESKMIL